MIILVNVLIGISLIFLVGFSVMLYLWADKYSYLKGYKHAETFIVHLDYTENTVFDSKDCVIFGKPSGEAFSISTKQIYHGRNDVLASSFMKGVCDCIISHKRWVYSE